MRQGRPLANKSPLSPPHTYPHTHTPRTTPEVRRRRSPLPPLPPQRLPVAALAGVASMPAALGDVYCRGASARHPERRRARAAGRLATLPAASRPHGNGCRVPPGRALPRRPRAAA